MSESAKPAKKPAGLPDPEWVGGGGVCMACGYSLDGLGTRGVCPECAAPFDERRLVLAGIANTNAGVPAGRRAAWTVIVAAAIVQYFTCAFQLVHVPIIMLCTSLSLAAALTYMLVTGKRERKSSERFILGRAGIARVAATSVAGATTRDAGFVAWGESDDVEIKRLSAFWRRVRVGTRDGGKLTNVCFDAGVRCPDRFEPEILAAIRGFVSRGDRTLEPLPPAPPAIGPAEEGWSSPPTP